MDGWISLLFDTEKRNEWVDGIGWDAMDKLIGSYIYIQIYLIVRLNRELPVKYNNANGHSLGVHILNKEERSNKKNEQGKAGMERIGWMDR